MDSSATQPLRSLVMEDRAMEEEALMQQQQKQEAPPLLTNSNILLSEDDHQQLASHHLRIVDDERVTYSDPSLDIVESSLEEEDIYTDAIGSAVSSVDVLGDPPRICPYQHVHHNQTTMTEKAAPSDEEEEEDSFDEIRPAEMSEFSYSAKNTGRQDGNHNVEESMNEGNFRESIHQSSESDAFRDEEIGKQENLWYQLTAISTSEESLLDESTIDTRGKKRFTRRILFVSSLLFLLFLLTVVTLPTVSFKRNGAAGKAAATAEPHCTTDCPFTTTAELYRAVDSYFAHKLTMNQTQRDDELANTTVAIKYGYPMNQWNVSLLRDFSEVFRAGARKSGPILTPDTKVIVERRLLEEDISGWDVSNARRMDYMFFGVATAKDWSVRSWNVGSVTDFSYMFASWVGQHDVGLGEWDVKSGRYMDYMFAEASSNVPIDFRRWNTGNARSMEGMFAQSNNVIGEGLQVWDVSKVQNMDGMFYVGSPPRFGLSRQQGYTVYNGASYSGDLNGWKVSSLRSANRMFYGNLNYQQSLCWWTRWLRDDVSTEDMFYGTNCASLEDPDQTAFCTLCEVCNTGTEGCTMIQPVGTRLRNLGLDRCLSTNYRTYFDGERVIG